ncbi:MAG: DUF2007 domain-containing protein [Verrucomicrobia bacterium]|nr:DUF2007 domain-containing protein [Verrucomicrobiota bacterium]MCH8529134.1 DUF2007 domain-containing protein [Kiritimatiellia bacterium]
MKTLTTVSWVTEADELCSLLASHDIDTFLPDETTAIVNPLYGGAIGGIRIQVAPEDFDRAQQVMHDWLLEHGQGLNPCPKCQSFDVHYERVSRRFAFLSLLLLGIPLLLIRKRYVCSACGHTWSPHSATGENCQRNR